MVKQNQLENCEPNEKIVLNKNLRKITNEQTSFYLFHVFRNVLFTNWF